jgi:hypothetical protein
MNKEDTYEICIEGGPRDRWQDWFEGLELLAVEPQREAPERTLLIVSAYDPSTLFGLLAQIGSLNVRLISVELRPKIH